MTTKALQDKTTLLAQFSQARSEILQLAKSLPAGKQAEVFLGIWSFHELLAHLSGWDQTNRAAAESIQAGRLPDFYAHKDRDWQSYNAHLVSQFQGCPLSELINQVEASQQELLTYLDSLPAEVLYKDFGVRYRGYRVTIARLIESEIYDEGVHLEQIREWLQG